MFLSVVTVIAVCLPFSQSLLFSVLGGNPQHISPFLISQCRPIQSSQHARVSCVYHPENLLCTSTCDAGYTLDGSSRVATLRCSMYTGWVAGSTFPVCRASLRPATGPGSSGQGTTAKCIRSLKDCPHLGDFQACGSCSKFVSCANDGVFIQDCPAGTYFDDNVKRCALRSDTCGRV